MEQSTNAFNVLAEKPVAPLLWQYAVPAIVAMAASSVYNVIDGIFIGQGVGPEAIMGLALTAPLMSLTAAFGTMVGVGAATLMSVKLGQKDYGTAQKILGNVVLMNLTMGVLLGIVLLVFIDPILRFFGASEVTLPYARSFMHVILLGNVITHLYFGLNAMLRSTNRPQKAMYATFGTVILNCILAPIFIFVWDWGIEGAALATVLAQVVMLGWQFRLFMNPKDLVHLDRQTLGFDGRIVRESLLVGLPQFLINLCACLVAAMMTRSLTTYGGDMAVGAFGICNRLILFIVMVVIGLNQGMQPIAGYNFGAKRYDRVIEVLKLALIGGSLITLLGFIVGTFFSTPIVTLFAKDSPELIAMAAHALECLVMMFPIVGIQIVSTAFFQSIGYAGKSIFLSLTRQLIFLVPAILILPHVFSDPLEGLWHAAPVADGLASILAITLLTMQVKKFKANTSAMG